MYLPNKNLILLLIIVDHQDPMEYTINRKRKLFR